ncbi:YoaK family protein [Rhodococcus sp. NPDC059968]|uniref:YoaK family protein n=1 Tax=Rhodococcus sp. NPDC059968 TaxID=3347017 RepID=UPI00366CF18D
MSGHNDQVKEIRTGQRRVVLMLVLTFVTGVLDAVGYLGLDKVFTGNMTGNVVILAMSLGSGEELPVLGPLIALVMFTLGAVGAGIALRTHAGRWNWTIAVLLTIGTAVLVTVGIATLVAGPALTHTTSVIIAAVIALQMGSQACIARKLAVRDMTTVVVTSTLTSLAGENFIRGRRDSLWNRRAGAICIIFVGAGAGTLLLAVDMTYAIAVSAIATATVAIIGHCSWDSPTRATRDLMTAGQIKT